MNIKYMEIAYKLAEKAYGNDEIPVGAIIVRNNKVIAKGKNDRQKKYSVLGHAEIKAIIKAEKKLKDWRLDGCDLYVTLKPCEMCKFIIKECRIKNVYYLLDSNYANNCSYKINEQKIDEKELVNNYKIMLKNFFKKMR